MDPEIEIGPWVSTRETVTGLLRLVLGTWSANPSDPLSAFCEMCYVSHCLRRATSGFVAYAPDGEVIGVCLVGGITNGRPHDDNEWAQREEHLTAFLSSMTPWHDMVRSCLAEIAEEDRMRQAVMGFGLHSDAEVLLLVVDAEWRRMGIGRRLIDETRRLAERRGWSMLFLMTDTGCDWGIYERLGLMRILSEPSQSDVACVRMAYAFTPRQLRWNQANY